MDTFISAKDSLPKVQNYNHIGHYKASRQGEASRWVLAWFTYIFQARYMVSLAIGSCPSGPGGQPREKGNNLYYSGNF